MAEGGIATKEKKNILIFKLAGGRFIHESKRLRIMYVLIVPSSIYFMYHRCAATTF